jgi:hypothetical protein
MFYSFEKTMKFHANSLNYFLHFDKVIHPYLNSFIFYTFFAKLIGSYYYKFYIQIENFYLNLHYSSWKLTLIKVENPAY